MIISIENKLKQIDNDNILFFIKSELKSTDPENFDYSVKLFLKDGTVVEGWINQEYFHDNRKLWLTFLQFQKLKQNMN